MAAERKKFDKYAEQYQNKYMDYAPYVETYKFLCEQITRDEAEILDVGCGPGNISRHLVDAKPGLKITGVDLAPNMIALAKANIPTGEFMVMDSRDIASLGKNFDAIISGFCFPYLSKQEVARFISDARAMLHGDGLIYISTMEGAYADSGFQSNNGVDHVYIYYHQVEYLTAQLTDNGFGVQRVERKQFNKENAPPDTDLFIIAKVL